MQLTGGAGAPPSLLRKEITSSKNWEEAEGSLASTGMFEIKRTVSMARERGLSPDEVCAIVEEASRLGYGPGAVQGRIANGNWPTPQQSNGAVRAGPPVSVDRRYDPINGDDANYVERMRLNSALGRAFDRLKPDEQAAIAGTLAYDPPLSPTEYPYCRFEILKAFEKRVSRLPGAVGPSNGR
jgi:hypothetical protein